MSLQFKIFRRDPPLPDWRSLILYIWLLGLILRISHLLFSADNPLLYMPVLDEKYYIDLGNAIAGGQLAGESGVFFMDPLYGYFLAALFYLFGDNLTTVRLIQIILDTFNVVLIYWIGARIWNRGAAIIAALLYALYPVAFFYSLLVLKTTLCLSMLLTFVLVLLWALDKKWGICWYAAGLLAALMTYLRGNFILVIPLTILFCFFYEKPGWRSPARQSVLLIAGLITLLSAGAFRNFLVSNEFVVFNSQAGRLFYSCNNPENLTGRYNVPSFAHPDPVSSEIDFHREAELRAGRQVTDQEASRYWAEETFRFLLQNPAKIPILFYNKLKGTLSNCEIANNHSYYTASRFSPLLRWPVPAFVFALAFGLPGLVLGIQRERKAAILLIPLFTVLITIIVFYTSSRFRMPAVPFLLMGSGICLSILYEWIKGRETAKAGMLLFCVGIIGVLSLSVSCPKGAGAEEFFLAKAYWREGRLAKARSIAMEGKAKYPGQGRFYNLLGMISSSGNRPGKALESYKAALKVEPENVDVHQNVGLLYLGMDRPNEAISWFRKALSIEARPPTFFYLAKAYEEVGEVSIAVENYLKYLETAKPADPLRGQAKQKISALGTTP